MRLSFNQAREEGRMTAAPATPFNLAPRSAVAGLSMLMPDNNDPNAGFKVSIDD